MTTKRFWWSLGKNNFFRPKNANFSGWSSIGRSLLLIPVYPGASVKISLNKRVYSLRLRVSRLGLRQSRRPLGHLWRHWKKTETNLVLRLNKGEGEDCIHWDVQKKTFRKLCVGGAKYACYQLQYIWGALGCAKKIFFSQNLLRMTQKWFCSVSRGWGTSFRPQGGPWGRTLGTQPLKIFLAPFRANFARKNASTRPTWKILPGTSRNTHSFVKHRHLRCSTSMSCAFWMSRASRRTRSRLNVSFRSVIWLL